MDSPSPAKSLQLTEARGAVRTNPTRHLTHISRRNRLGSRGTHGTASAVSRSAVICGYPGRFGLCVRADPWIWVTCRTILPGLYTDLLRRCPVLTGRSRSPAALGVIRGLKPVSGAFPGRLGRRVRMTILCNSTLPAVLPRPWRQKKEAPLPARILTNGPRQTRQDLNRMPEEGVQKWTGCPRTPLEPTTGERHAQKYPRIRVMHRWRWVHFIMGLVGYSTRAGAGRSPTTGTKKLPLPRHGS